MLYFDSVSKIYKKKDHSLVDINLNIEKGEFVSIVGSSGSGKTTLLKLILGEIKATEGNVYFNSRDISRFSQKKLNRYRRKVGAIFQEFRLISNKNVYENVAFSMEVAGKSEKQLKKDVPHVLKLVRLEKKQKSFPKELSGGEKQRVAIARAIVNNPDIIIADEPTGNLDPVNTRDIIEILKKINSFGTTVILTTHNKEVVDSLKKRVITLDEGSIVRDNTKGTFIIN